MISHKEKYIEIHEELYHQAIEDGMTDDDAERHADEHASEDTMEYFDIQGDYLYEQQKDARRGL